MLRIIPGHTGLECSKKMTFGRISCLFNRHRPNREKVTWDGLNYNSDCAHCGKRIFRLHGGGWRAVRAPQAQEQGHNPG
jgi:acetyl esterase/lipase